MSFFNIKNSHFNFFLFKPKLKIGLNGFSFFGIHVCEKKESVMITMVSNGKKQKKYIYFLCQNMSYDALCGFIECVFHLLSKWTI